MFGSTSTFGSAPQAFGSSTFSSGATTSNVFAQQAPAASTSLFGSNSFAQPKPTTFGTSFGSTQQASMFGQQNRLGTSTMFSSAAGASPFATAGQVQQPQGTSIPFNAITGTDTMMKNAVASPINTRHQCITCMKDYEHKSLEELRLEDYQLGRKGSAQPANLFGAQTQPTGGLFSSMAPTTGTTNTFGQRTTTFGAAPAPATTGGLFSNLSQPKTSNFFSSAPAATTFGNSSFTFPNTSQQQQQASLFGQTTGTVTSTGIGTTQSPFSFSQPTQQATSLFGQKPATTPAAAVQPFGSFGTATSTANKPLSLFSTPFGQSTAPPPAFGSTAPTSTASLFQNTTQAAKTPFSFSAAPTFGQPSVSSSFGTPTTSNFSFAPATSSGLNFGTSGFGATTTTSALPTFNQSTFNPTFSLGGAPASTSGFGGITGFGGSAQGLGTTFLGAPTAGFGQPNIQQGIGSTTAAVPFATTPYKDSPLFYNLMTNRNVEEMSKPTNPMAQRAIKEASRRRSSSTFVPLGTPQAIRNMTFPISKTQTFNKQTSIFDGFEEEGPGPVVDILSPKTSVKKLSMSVVRSRLSMPVHNSYSTPSPCSTSGYEDTYEPLTKGNRDYSVRNGSLEDEDRPDANESYVNGTQPFSEISSSSSNGQLDEENESPPIVARTGKSGVVCSNPDYFVSPPVEELDLKTDVDGKCFVRGFIVGRTNYGQIKYYDVINVAGINIDKTVMFRHKEVVVYPEESESPPVGQGLNCPAEITMNRIWPLDKQTKDPIKSPERIRSLKYEALLRKSCDRMDAKFISYDENSGVWVFAVKHFSKYSCVPEENEQDDMETSSLESPCTGLGGISSALLKGGRSLDLLARPGHGGGDVPSISTISTRKSLARDSPPGGKIHTYRSSLGGFNFGKDLEYLMDEGCAESELNEVHMNPLTPSDGDSGSDISGASSQNDAEIEIADLSPSRKSKLRQASVFDSILEEEKNTNTNYSSSKHDMIRSFLEMSDFDYETGESQPPNKKSRSPRMAPPLEKTHWTSGFASRTYVKSDEMHQGSQHVSRIARTQHRNEESQNLIITDQQSMIMDEQTWNPEREKFKRSLDNTTIRPGRRGYHRREEIVPKAVAQPLGLFHNLTQRFQMVNIRRAGRVCFGPNGHFVHVQSNGFSGRVVVKKLESRIQVLDAHRTTPLYENILHTELDLYLSKARNQIHRYGLVNKTHLVESHIEALESVQKGEEAGVRTQHHYKAIKEELQIWKLIQTLWTEEAALTFADKQDQVFHMQQREKVSKWLQLNGSFLFEEQVTEEDKSVLGLLLKGKKTEACQQAIQEKNITLALCLAQLSPYSQRHCRNQCTTWEREGVVPFIHPMIRSIYKLCGGHPLWEEIDLENMTTSQWLHQFSMFLWYLTPAHLSVDDLVGVFQEAVRNSIPGLDCYQDHSAPALADRTNANLCIHLLKLHATIGYPINKMLCPSSRNVDKLDYKLSWFLMLNFQQLGQTIEPDLFECITCGFASQLEKIGRWEWAIFVLTHLPRNNFRTVMIKRMLEMSLGKQVFDLEYAKKLRFIENLGISIKDLILTKD